MPCLLDHVDDNDKHKPSNYMLKQLAGPCTLG